MKATTVIRWSALLLAAGIPIVVAATSPLLQYREPVYIIAGFAGIITLAILLIQPLLLISALPGVEGRRGRRMHLWLGVSLLVAVVVHVVGLYITSPPDVIDALLFRSPTPFSLWGVIAMWAVLAAALLGIFRRRLALKAATWRVAHTIVALLIVAGTVIHALEIDGAMGNVSKIVLCVFVVCAMLLAVTRLKSWVFLTRRVAGFGKKGA